MEHNFTPMISIYPRLRIFALESYIARYIDLNTGTVPS